jgi:uncharacterized tellurite resistance protein B-like protein
MLDMLRRFVSDLTSDAPTAKPADGTRLATIAILIEAARIDGDFNEVERERIATLVEQRFGIGELEATALMKEAEARAEGSSDFHGFTAAINRGLEHDERGRIIEMLWEVSLADGELDALEDSLIRRVAGLIYVDDNERAAARHRALARLGRADPAA